VSPMARSQQMEEVYATEQYIQSVGAIAAIDKTVLDNINFDAAAQIIGNRRGVPADIIRTADEVAEVRQIRQQQEQAQAEQQQQQAMQEMAGQAVAKGLEGQIAQQTATGAIQ